MREARIARDESLIDKALGVAPWWPPGLRLWAARRAAARGLGSAALRAAAEDPLVLARLGMHGQARTCDGGGRPGVVARAAAAGAMGDSGPARGLNLGKMRLSVPDRRFLAASLAPFDPLLALAMLPSEDHADRAACAMAAGDYPSAERSLSEAVDDARARYLPGALAAWRGDWRVARGALNHAFAADGLAPPLEPGSDRPTTLDAFAGRPVPAAVDGPLISIVVPAHNAATTLPVSLRSLLTQTWRNIELLVVDDRSDDATLSIAARLAQRDARIRVLSNARSAGAYGARNTGIEAARGGFIALHDADDWAHPQRLERQMRVLGKNKAATVCRYFRLDIAGRPVCPRVFPFVRMSPIAVTTRAEVWTSAGLFDEAPVGADSEWLARVDERWGRRAAPRSGEVGMVALWDAGSLSGSPATGLTGDGLRRRLEYVARWRRRHAGLE